MRKIVIGVVGVVVVIAISSYFLFYHPNSNNIAVGNVEVLEDYYTKELPEKPANYDLVLREIERNYVDLSDLGPEYYLQPDFYPGWRVGREFYTKHDYSRWGVYGHGAYPANPTITFTSRDVGGWISFSTLYKTGYGIETYQGIRLVPQSSEYFDISVSPNQFLLEPTFPYFYKGWVQPITIKVTIKAPVEPGTYKVAFEVLPPNNEQRKKWVWEVLNKESSEQEQYMLNQAQEMYGDNIPDDWEGWISIGRKNKYVDASIFSMENRVTLEIVVV